MNFKTKGATLARGLATTLTLLTATGLEAASVSFGAADTFAVLAGTTVTNTGSSVISGNVGVSPGSSITGFPPGVVSDGSIHSSDTLAIQAHADSVVAYAELTGLVTTVDLTGQDLGSMTLTPGVYSFSSSAQLTGTLTLDGQGFADPLFVFKIGSTLITAASSDIVLINGALASNIYFQVGSSTTLGATSTFKGTIVSQTDNNLGTGANVEGRVLALDGQTTLSGNTITVPLVIPEPGTASLAAVGLGAFALRRNRRKATV